MEIHTKYNFGDKVWNIVTTPKQLFISCGFCNGSGRIVGKNGIFISCPECRGKGENSKWENQGWRVGNQLTIGEVRVEIRAEDSIGFEPDTIFANYGPQQAHHKENYMCRESGIGSGTLHDIDRLWPTKEEAQIECDKRNND